MPGCVVALPKIDSPMTIVCRGPDHWTTLAAIPHSHCGHATIRVLGRFSMASPQRAHLRRGNNAGLHADTAKSATSISVNAGLPVHKALACTDMLGLRYGANILV